MRAVILTKGKVAMVDDEDYAELSRQKWRALKEKHTWYAVRDVYPGGKCVRLRMHRVILHAPPQLDVDHKNGDGLDNRRSNLRLADTSLNQQNRKRLTTNTSGYRGVTFHKLRGKWQSGIKKDGRSFHLGLFDTPEMAARLRRQGKGTVRGVCQPKLSRRKVGSMTPVKEPGAEGEETE